MAKTLVRTYVGGFDEEGLRGGIPRGHVAPHRRLGFQILAIDSWDAIELVLEFRDRRAETFAFFEWLRDLGVTSFLVSEEPAQGRRDGAPEAGVLPAGGG